MDLAISHNLQCMEWNAIELIADMQSRVIIIVITFVKFHVSLSRDCQRQTDRDKTTQSERVCAVCVRASYELLYSWAHKYRRSDIYRQTDRHTCTQSKYSMNSNILSLREFALNRTRVREVCWYYYEYVALPCSSKSGSFPKCFLFVLRVAAFFWWWLISNSHMERKSDTHTHIHITHIQANARAKTNVYMFSMPMWKKTNIIICEMRKSSEKSGTAEV